MPTSPRSTLLLLPLVVRPSRKRSVHMDAKNITVKTVAAKVCASMESGGSNVTSVLLRETNIHASTDAKDLNANHAKAEGFVNIIVYDPIVQLVKVVVFAYMDA
jgi:hypothetical protein